MASPVVNVRYWDPTTHLLSLRCLFHVVNQQQIKTQQ